MQSSTCFEAKFCEEGINCTLFFKPIWHFPQNFYGFIKILYRYIFCERRWYFILGHKLNSWGNYVEHLLTFRFPGIKVYYIRCLIYYFFISIFYLLPLLFILIHFFSCLSLFLIIIQLSLVGVIKERRNNEDRPWYTLINDSYLFRYYTQSHIMHPLSTSVHTIQFNPIWLNNKSVYNRICRI